MNTEHQLFLNLLDQATSHAKNYVIYSPSQIARGDHLKNDTTVGERAWSIPKTTGQFLYSLIINLGFKTALELGTSIGYSTLWIAAALDEQGEHAHMITLEKNPEKSEIAHNTLGSHFPFVQFHSGMIGNYLPMIPSDATFDFIFMDADRGNYQEYWNYLKHFLHQKSIVVIDNALRDQKSVHEFQDTLDNDPDFITLLYLLDNGLYIVARADSGHILDQFIR